MQDKMPVDRRDDKSQKTRKWNSLRRKYEIDLISIYAACLPRYMYTSVLAMNPKLLARNLASPEFLAKFFFAIASAEPCFRYFRRSRWLRNSATEAPHRYVSRYTHVSFRVPASYAGVCSRLVQTVRRAYRTVIELVCTKCGSRRGRK